MLNPIIEALKLEGSYHLKPPCFNKELINLESPICMHGSPWSEIGQRIMSGLSDLNKEKEVEKKGFLKYFNDKDSNFEKFNVTVNDNFHRVWAATPSHIPVINNKCNSTMISCNLNITTVSELNYEYEDDLDLGISSNTAQEIKSKFVSRQNSYISAGFTNTTFDIDSTIKCSDINKKSFEWALNAVPSEVKARYLQYGIPYEFGDDTGPYNAGPLWIWHYMTYEMNKEKTANVVHSPYMSTPVDYWLSSAAGFHYCKILSPARAIEWIYLDGLREKLGLKNKK